MMLIHLWACINNFNINISLNNGKQLKLSIDKSVNHNIYEIETFINNNLMKHSINNIEIIQSMIKIQDNVCKLKKCEKKLLIFYSVNNFPTSTLICSHSNFIIKIYTIYKVVS